MKMKKIHSIFYPWAISRIWSGIEKSHRDILKNKIKRYGKDEIIGKNPFSANVYRSHEYYTRNYLA